MNFMDKLAREKGRTEQAQIFARERVNSQWWTLETVKEGGNMECDQTSLMGGYVSATRSTNLITNKKRHLNF